MIRLKLKSGVLISSTGGFTTFKVSLTDCNTMLSISVEPLLDKTFASCTLPFLLNFTFTFTWFVYAYSFANNKSADNDNFILFPAVLR